MRGGCCRPIVGDAQDTMLHPPDVVTILVTVNSLAMCMLCSLYAGSSLYARISITER